MCIKSFCLFPCMWHDRINENVWTNLVHFLFFHFDLPANVECSILWTVVIRCPTQFKVFIMAVVFQVHICSSVSRMLLKISKVILIFFFQSRDRFQQSDKRDGNSSTSRFGLSLSTLGDINKDGYGGKHQEFYNVPQRFLV